MINKKFIVTGGGSGGHVSAASALIQSLIEDYGVNPLDITYIGGDLGMVGEKSGSSLEQKKFKDVNFNTKFIRAGKLQRTFSFSSVKLLFRSILGLKDAFSFVQESKADLLISTGGFVSVPVCIWGWIFNKPIFLHEQTASVGLSNRIVGKFAKSIYTAFKESNKYFKGKRVEHVGNIVRKAIFKSTEDGVSEQVLKIVKIQNNKPLIYISGGGLGSHVINEKILRDVPAILQKYRVILQMGDNSTFKDFENAQEILKSLVPEVSARFLPVKYIEDNDIGYIYHHMDMFVGRSGANTVYEIGILQKPSIFIPIPWVTHNEQYLNAKVLEDLGIAKILNEKDLTDTDITKDIERFFEQTKIRKINKEKISELFPVNATVRMIEDIFTQL